MSRDFESGESLIWHSETFGRETDRPNCQCVIPSLYFQESHSAQGARTMILLFHSIAETAEELKPSECKADLDLSILEGRHNVIPSENI